MNLKLTKQISTIETIFYVFLLSMMATHGAVMPIVRFLGFVAAVLFLLFRENKEYKKYISIALPFVLSINFIENFYVAANHYFVATYISIFFALYSYFEEYTDLRLTKNISQFIVVIMVFATTHKFASEYFLNGNLLGDYFFFGKLFKGVPFSESLLNSFAQNKESFTQLQNLNYETSRNISTIFEGSVSLIKWVSISIAITELLLTIGYIFRDKFNHYFDVFVILFVFGTHAFRQENHFLSLLLILTALTTKYFDKMKAYYLGSIIYLLSAAIIL